MKWIKRIISNYEKKKALQVEETSRNRFFAELIDTASKNGNIYPVTKYLRENYLNKNQNKILFDAISDDLILWNFVIIKSDTIDARRFLEALSNCKAAASRQKKISSLLSQDFVKEFSKIFEPFATQTEVENVYHLTLSLIALPCYFDKIKDKVASLWITEEIRTFKDGYFLNIYSEHLSYIIKRVKAGKIKRSVLDSYLERKNQGETTSLIEMRHLEMP